MAFAKLFVFGFLALSVIYLSLSTYFRSVRRENLEDDWREEHPDGGDLAARDAYIEAGMKEYHSSLRRKLIGLVYVVPLVTLLVIIFTTN